MSNPRHQITAAGLIDSIDPFMDFQRPLRQFQRPLMILGRVVQGAEFIQGGELAHIFQADGATTSVFRQRDQVWNAIPAAPPVPNLGAKSG